ncbi:apolipoprotein N-acyltransferase [uncultured Roseobacter sp.]|uniref:apolipoprotein N-acyltransferase n=1 Tax=uncultured Roseobacter sp. TaxID=114847 RepID=UPI002624A594|nr:apolipoprotein N-acyltransferase [uncultured Roseobacter sp.]
MPQARPGGYAPRGWYAERGALARSVLAAAVGGVGALGQAPYDLPILLFLALVLGFVMLRRQPSARAAGRIGWCMGLGYFAVALVWILQPFQVDPDRHGWMAPFALVLLSGGLALFWGLAFYLARRLSRRSWPLILTWTAAELARAYVFTGFPWANPAQVLVDGAAGQGLSMAGPHGMTLWLLSCAWCVSLPVPRLRARVMRAGQAVLLGLVALGLHLPPGKPPAPLTEHTVRLIQPNAAQHLKWQPEHAFGFFETQLALTAAAPEPGTPLPALTVWPETAIPWTYEGADEALTQIRTAAGGRAVAVGVLRRPGERLFNSLVLLPGGGAPDQIYDKHHLVPFGEYIPLSPIAERLGLTGLAQVSATGFQRGPGPRTLDFGALGRGLPLICYEAVFAHDVNGAPARPDFLIQITNDAWFGQYAGPQQHLAQARMRAIEQGLPLMRAANTGVSAMIDPYGRILRALPLGEQGFIDAPLPAPLPKTLYSRTGDLPLALLLLIGLSTSWLRRIRSN